MYLALKDLRNQCAALKTSLLLAKMRKKEARDCRNYEKKK